MIADHQNDRIAVTTLVTAIAPATAQNWPTRPVTIVYPFGAGSAGDVLGRIFASRLSELLGQPVIFENVGGAGGMTGASRVAKAAPDGYQVLLGTTSTLAVNQTFYRNPLYNAVTDFAPVALIAESPIVLVARKDLPANNLQEFIAHAKANQAKMQYGSAGVGSSVHLACAGLNAAIGVSITHIPYRGGGSAMQDLIAGRIDYQCPAAELAIPHIQGNSVKAIAVLTKNRSPTLPNLASAHEQGLANFDAGAWFSFCPAQGHACCDRAEASQCHCRCDGRSCDRGAPEGVRLRFGCARPQVARISPKIHPERDRQMGRPDQSGKHQGSMTPTATGCRKRICDGPYEQHSCNSDT
jgi:tripartite-type tricarboxylate transporter receptor subunit TctC